MRSVGSLTQRVTRSNPKTSCQSPQTFDLRCNRWSCPIARLCSSKLRAILRTTPWFPGSIKVQFVLQRLKRKNASVWRCCCFGWRPQACKPAASVVVAIWKGCHSKNRFHRPIDWSTRRILQLTSHKVSINAPHKFGAEFVGTWKTYPVKEQEAELSLGFRYVWLNFPPQIC